MVHAHRHNRALLCVLALTLTLPVSADVARADEDPPATPQAECGPGSVEESLQGRMSAADVDAQTEFRCNAEGIGQFGPAADGSAGAGGYKVHRYVDSAGHECGYYDTTLLFPLNLPQQQESLTGIHVLDMSDPTDPVKTANLLTPAMQSPHESLSINQERGLLAAGMGTPITAPGWVDIYDISEDCRFPVLKSSLPMGILGHEGNFSPDGNTLWISSTGGSTLTAIDVTIPEAPVALWAEEHRFHGLTVSDDGNTLYAADLGDSGLAIMDVSEIQSRELNPQVHEIGHLTWPVVTIPQQPMPVEIGGHPYLVEVDEFTRNTSTDPSAPVGAARIIDIADPANPFVVSDLRLEVNQRVNRPMLADDPGASSSLAGYTAHYCAVPSREEPGIVACSFVLSGLRVFDITDPHAPVEIAYYNPVGGQSYAMSAPAFVPERNEIWYSDGNKGFHVVRVTNDMWPSPSSCPPPGRRDAGASAAADLGTAHHRPDHPAPPGPPECPPGLG